MNSPEETRAWQDSPPPTGYAQQPPTGTAPPAGAPPHGQPGAWPAGAAPQMPAAGAGYPQPGYGVPMGPPLKDKMVAGILGIVLGGLGVHRFYLGYIGIGIAQIFVTIFTLGIGAWWGVIEGIMILVTDTWTDAEGRPLKGNEPKIPYGYGY